MDGRSSVFLVLCLCLPATAMAQLSTGTISGAVQDATGAIIPGVTVTLSSPGVIGGNQQGMFTGTNESMQSNNISSELNAKLRQQIPAVVLAANPDIKPGQQIQSLLDTAASLSGPVVRDKLWLTTSVIRHR